MLLLLSFQQKISREQFFSILHRFTINDMKQIFFSFLILVFAGQLQAQVVSQRQALIAANTYFRTHTGRENAELSVRNAPLLRGQGLSGASVAYYVCQPADGKGFVIVSGTKAAIPILAYSPFNTFPMNNIPPSVEYLLEDYRTQLESIAQHHLKPSASISSNWEALETGSYATAESSIQFGPLLTTKWSQGAPYNGQCPFGAVTGCVATAMAQIMKYWNYPTVGQGGLVSYTDNQGDVTGTFAAQIGGTVYDWQNMTNTYPETPSASISALAVSKLMNHCGVSVCMDYGAEESSAFSSWVPYALTTYFGYEPLITLAYRELVPNDADWKSAIKNEIVSSRPVYYCGTNGQGGHAWVCDGYLDDLFSMNWGWGGQYDAFYTLDNLNPGNIYLVGAYHTHRMLTGIKPPNCRHNYEGYGTLNSQNIEVANYIHLYTNIPSSAVVNLNAFSEVTLYPGFTANAGCTMNAYIQGCDGFSAPSSEERSDTMAEVYLMPVTDFSIAPNPFSTATTITYRLEEAQNVDIRIFNATGTLVSTPVQPQRQEAGDYSFTFGEADLPIGLYFLVAQLGDRRVTKRLVRTQ